MRKKKVLFFVEAMGGGVFTYITNLANGLSEDFDVYATDITFDAMARGSYRIHLKKDGSETVFPVSLGVTGRHNIPIPWQRSRSLICCQAVIRRPSVRL